MGYRDDTFIDDHRADEAIRQVLAHIGEPAFVAPPPDLVTRTLRRLPPEPPGAAAARLARQRIWRLTLTAIALGLLGLVALVSALGVLGMGPPLAMLFGNGGSGISRTLLTFDLLAKPLLGVVGAVAAPLSLGCALSILAMVLAWRRLRIPLSLYAENRP